MAKFTIRQVSTKGFDDLIRIIETNISNFKKESNNLGTETLKHMHNTISSGKKRTSKAHTDTNPKASKESLLHSIDIEFFPNETGFGIGNIDKLNQVSPHWRVINFGGYVPPSTRAYPSLKGHFVPNEGGIFEKGQPKFPIYPTKPIEGINYIQKASDYLVRQMQRLGKILNRGA